MRPFQRDGCKGRYLWQVKDFYKGILCFLSEKLRGVCFIELIGDRADVMEQGIGKIRTRSDKERHPCALVVNDALHYHPEIQSCGRNAIAKWEVRTSREVRP